MSDALAHLSFVGDFESQVNELIKARRMSRNEINQLESVFKYLNELFQSMWEGCLLELFGSVTTGLAMKGSDIDIVVTVPTWVEINPVSCVIRTRSILQDNADIDNITAVTKTKIPLIQFTYRPTNTQCDVSFSGRSAVKNSQLLDYLITIDDRILPLMFVIKYWSKLNNITGKDLMPNYCLILLIIFFLQRRGILPSVKYLQEHIEQEIIDNWNCAFARALGLSNDNTESLYSIIGGFFEFYRTFDFGRYIISLYTGDKIEKSCFDDLRDVPMEFVLYKSNVSDTICNPLVTKTIMCVQDPFKHDRNAGIAVKPDLFKRIRTLLSKAANIFEASREDDFLHKLLSTDTVPRPELHSKSNRGRGRGNFLSYDRGRNRGNGRRGKFKQSWKQRGRASHSRSPRRGHQAPRYLS